MALCLASSAPLVVVEFPFPGFHVNIDQHEMLVSALSISANFVSAFYESLGDRLYRKL